MKLRIILNVLSLTALLSTWTGGYLYHSSLKKSAHENGATKAQAMESGAVDFIQKPFGEKELLGAIEKGLSKTTLRGKNIKF